MVLGILIVLRNVVRRNAVRFRMSPWVKLLGFLRCAATTIEESKENDETNDRTNNCSDVCAGK